VQNGGALEHPHVTMTSLVLFEILSLATGHITCLSFFYCCCSFIHTCIHCLDNFSTLPRSPTLPLLVCLFTDFLSVGIFGFFLFFFFLLIYKSTLWIKAITLFLNT
jgi:hypothetical protein